MTPPTPIDPDLVELRCKLRGWLYYRDPEDRYVEMPAHGLTVYPSGHFDRFGPHAAKAGPFTRPRLTLAAIIADPGEGWTAKYDGERAEFYSEGVAVYFGGPQLPWASVDDADPITLVRRHRAVTDLLVRLAEVEPRA